MPGFAAVWWSGVGPTGPQGWPGSSIHFPQLMLETRWQKDPSKSTHMLFGFGEH